MRHKAMVRIRYSRAGLIRVSRGSTGGSFFARDCLRRGRAGFRLCPPFLRDWTLNRLSLLVHGSVALVSGLISLTLLLIAPLGLATVIVLTLLLTAVSFLGGFAGERMLRWLGAARTGRSAMALRVEGATRQLPSSRKR